MNKKEALAQLEEHLSEAPTELKEHALKSWEEQAEDADREQWSNRSFLPWVKSKEGFYFWMAISHKKWQEAQAELSKLKTEAPTELKEYTLTLEQKYKEQYEAGFPVFDKLFQLKKDDFIKVMKDIFQDNESVMGILENKPRVVKTLNDDEPEEMQIHFYSSISVNYAGVRFKPEHGSSEMILKFDKFFNVDVALKELKNN